MNYRLLGKRVLVKIVIPDDLELQANGQFVQKTQGSELVVVVPYKPNRGVVIKKGDEITKLNEKDMIVFEDFAPTFFDIQNRDLCWIEEDYVVAVVEN